MSVCEVNKNSLERIRFQISEFRGKEYADLRIYYLDTLTDEWKPSKKGLTISPEIWPEFRKGIEELESELKSRGLVDSVEMPQESHTSLRTDVER